MIKIRRYKGWFGQPDHLEFWRDGLLIGKKDFGKITLIHYNKVNYLSRAQGYKYWDKYFPDRNRYTLPEELQEALDEPCNTWGYYTDKNGELMVYEG